MAETLNMSQSPSERESIHYSGASAFCNPAEASRGSAGAALPAHVVLICGGSIPWDC